MPRPVRCDCGNSTCETVDVRLLSELLDTFGGHLDCACSPPPSPPHGIPGRFTPYDLLKEFLRCNNTHNNELKRYLRRKLPFSLKCLASKVIADCAGASNIGIDNLKRLLPNPMYQCVLVHHQPIISEQDTFYTKT